MSEFIPILCLDFDGVIHSYTSGWKGPRNIPDPPVSGAMDFLYRSVGEFKVCIYSSRSKSPFAKRAMRIWLRKHLEDYFIAEHQDLIKLAYQVDANPDPPDSPWTKLANEVIDKIKFPTRKPAAFLTVDDRAIQFNGPPFPSPKELKQFKPWYKRTKPTIEELEAILKEAD